MGYEDSKYYGILGKLTDNLMEGRISQEQFDEANLKALDDELGWPDKGGEWLAHHYNSTAEYLADSVIDGTELAKPLEELIEEAKKEIAIFRKHGFHGEADMMQGMLERAIIEFEEDDEDVEEAE